MLTRYPGWRIKMSRQEYLSARSPLSGTVSCSFISQKRRDSLDWFAQGWQLRRSVIWTQICPCSVSKLYVYFNISFFQSGVHVIALVRTDWLTLAISFELTRSEVGSEILYFCIPRDADLVDSGMIADPGIHRYTGPISLGYHSQYSEDFLVKGLRVHREGRALSCGRHCGDRLLTASQVFPSRCELREQRLILLTFDMSQTYLL